MASSTNAKKSTALSSAGRPPAASGIKFSRRNSSGRIVSLSRDDDLDISEEISGGPNDYINYTVVLPSTPDNQPMAEPSSDNKKTTRFGPEPNQRPRRGGEDDGTTDSASSKMGRGMSIMRSGNKSMLLRSQTGDFDHNRWLFETKGRYGIGNAYWSPDQQDGFEEGVTISDFMDKPWKPLTRKINVPAAVLSPYR